MQWGVFNYIELRFGNDGSCTDDLPALKLVLIYCLDRALLDI